MEAHLDGVLARCRRRMLAIRKLAAASWPGIYGDIEEEDPPGRPQERGNGAEATMLAGAAHAGSLAGRRPQAGAIMLASKAPATWRSKRQGTVEASTFGSELVALRVGMEMNEGLRYKLKMMGIPVAGPSNVLCDNKVAADNSALPEPQLKKKRLSICYHYVRECCAKLAARIAFEDSCSNLADICTKVLGKIKRKELCKGLLY